MALKNKFCIIRRCASGFTLLEIVVALAVIGLTMGIVVGGMNTYLDADMKSASNKLSSTIRYLYNKSAMEGLYIRLVMDLEERSYWVEATSDPVAIEREDEYSDKKKKDERRRTKDEKEQVKKEGKGSDIVKDAEKITGMKEEPEETGPQKLKVPEPTFGAVDSYLLKPTRLPETVFIKDVQVEHRQKPVEGGKEFIYFFPNGYVEHAVINLRDEDDEVHYSLETNPVSGRVSIEDRYRMLGGD